MTATPRLLETYEEARFLWEAKGWGMEGAGTELAEKPELKPFGLSQPTFSRKTKPGSKFPIEPEVAAAVESLKTWPGYERQAEIATRGLLALHGVARGEDVGQLVKEMREYMPGEIALTLIDALEEKAGARESKLIDVLEEKAGAREGKLIDALEEKAGAREGKLIDALEEKAGARESKLIDALEEKADARESNLLQAVGRLGRLTWRHVAISGGAGAVVAVLLVPFLFAFARPSHVFIIYPPAGRPDASPRWFEPGSALAMFEWGEKMPKPPVDQTVPDWTLPGQKVAPCDARVGMKEINGNCWLGLLDLKPPCGALFRHGDKCYAPVSAKPWPAEPGPDR